MNTTHREESKAVKIVLITISVLFLVLMLVLPLLSVVINSLREGIKFYFESLSTEYVRSALKVTFLATIWAVAVNTFFGIAASWLLTKFSFKGKQFLATLIDIPFSISPVIAGLAFLMTFGRLGWASGIIDRINAFFGTDIKIVFALPGVVLATIFVTFPFVSRERTPVLNVEGRRGGGSGGTHGNRKVLPCSGRSRFRISAGHCFMELSYVPRVRSENSERSMRFPRPEGKRLHCRLMIDALYLSGSADSTTAAFAASSILGHHCDRGADP